MERDLDRPARDADDDDGAALGGERARLGDRGGVRDAVEHDVRPVREARADQVDRAGIERVGGEVGAQLARELALPRKRVGDGDRRGAVRAGGEHREEADRARAEHGDHPVAHALGDADGVLAVESGSTIAAAVIDIPSGTRWKRPAGATNASASAPAVWQPTTARCSQRL